MRCRGAALAIAVVAIVVIAGVAIWLNDGDDDATQQTEDVNLYIREDIRIGDYIQAQYTYPDLLDVPIPIRMEVTAVTEDSCTVTAEFMDETVTETFALEDILKQDAEMTYLGDEAKQTPYGYVLCEKYNEASETENYTSWYVDDVLVAMDGTFDGMRCIVEVIEYSFVTEIVGSQGSQVSYGNADFFYYGTPTSYRATFDIFGQNMTMNLYVDEVNAGGVRAVSLRISLMQDGIREIDPSQIRIEDVCSSGLELEAHSPGTGDQYTNYPGMMVLNNSSRVTDDYSITLDNLDEMSLDYLQVDGLNSSYTINGYGGTISGTVTVVTPQGSISNVFTLTIGASSN